MSERRGKVISRRVVRRRTGSGPSWAGGPAVEVLPVGAPRPDWHRVRLSGIGGSDALAALNLSPWSTPYTLWLDKTGRRPPTPASGRMVWGNMLEPLVAWWFTKITGLKIGVTGTWRHPVPLFDDGHGFARYALCNPDRYVIGEHAGVEIKTVSDRSPDVALWKDGVPDYPEAQAQWNMGVTGALRWYVAAAIDGCEAPIIHCTERNDDLIGDLRESNSQFIRDHVYPDKAPPADATPATTKALAAAALARVTGAEVRAVDLGEHGRKLVARRRELKATEKTTKDDLRAVENEIKAALIERDADAVLLDGDKWLRYKRGTRAGYTVPAGEYTELREVKAK